MERGPSRVGDNGERGRRLPRLGVGVRRYRVLLRQEGVTFGMTPTGKLYCWGVKAAPGAG